MYIQTTLQEKLGKEIAQASNEEIYDALLSMVQEMAGEKERTDSKKKLYYISAEFLIGKLLSNNMINLGIFNEVKDVLAQNGKNIAEIEEVEPEPSLGNGGLGRLAACFLDSIATLGLAGDGVGLNYHLGLFKQEFKNNLQRETPNPWIESKSWLKKTDVIYPVSFKGLNVNARMFDRLVAIKHANKKALCKYLEETQGVKVSADTIFDIQIKRLHEYKRQQLNALYIIDKYLEIKAGKIPAAPVTAIFGAKAAPAYVIAKDIIHLILCLQEIINNDPEVSPYLKVVMVENYNVTKAEKLIPACDISEQISLASKEASGTGNMKFMLNGAITLGTEDGANVEIHELVGNDNIFVFGASSDDVIEHYVKADYVAKDFYEKNPSIKAAIDFITSDEILKVGQKENLERLQHEIISKDWFMTLLDFDSYKEKKEEALKAYTDQKTWAKKALVNIARAGYFSSDRTIEEYNNDIWHL